VDYSSSRICSRVFETLEKQQTRASEMPRYQNESNLRTSSAGQAENTASAGVGRPQFRPSRVNSLGRLGRLSDVKLGFSRLQYQQPSVNSSPMPSLSAADDCTVTLALCIHTTLLPVALRDPLLCRTAPQAPGLRRQAQLLALPSYF
jgi:hypothetical protein